MSPGSRNQVCKFWKAGKCHRGSECAFQHPPKPAAPSAKDDKRGKSKNKRKKKKKKKKGDRSRSSSRGSNTSKGSQSLKEKGGKTSSGSAAVCLMRALVMVAAIYPTTSCHRVPESIALPSCNHPFHLAMPVISKRSVSFGDFVEKYDIPIEHDCNLNPCSAKQRAFNPVCIDMNDRSRKETIESRESDAILAAQMLQSAVARELQGPSCPCNFSCDSDIGCRYCIRQDLKAVPGHMPLKQRKCSRRNRMDCRHR